MHNLNSLQQEILQYRGTTYYQFPPFLCLFVQAEAQNLQKKESHTMTTNSSRQNPNISATTKQQLEHLQHSKWHATISTHVHKIVKDNYWFCHVCLSTWNSLAPTGWIFMKFEILRNFLKPAEEIQVFMLKLTQIMGTLHESPCKFIISCWIILGIWNVSYESCKDDQNIHCTVNFFSKIHAVYEIMRKNMVQTTTEHRKDAICLPNN